MQIQTLHAFQNRILMKIIFHIKIINNYFLSFEHMFSALKI